MDVIVTSSNLIRLNFLVCLLKDAGIRAEILDAHISAAEGMIGAFPRRLAVDPDDSSRARFVLRQAGEL